MVEIRRGENGYMIEDWESGRKNFYVAVTIKDALAIIESVLLRRADNG